VSLKFKKKIYLSLDEDLLKFVDKQISALNTTRSDYIRKLLIIEYEVQTKRTIDKIIEGK
jgi:metal-responsive CopG/Arc/MetJ family transcriptional regulator